MPVQNTRDMVNALQEAGATAVQYTEYPHEKHQSWERAYREETLFSWMFAQHK